MRVSEPQVRKDSRLFEELCAALLRRGNAVQFRVNGASMQPNLLDGDDVLVAPVNREELRRGDVVLARNDDGLRVHRVQSFAGRSGAPTISSDTGLNNDPPVNRVFGKVIASRRGIDEQQFTNVRTRFVHPARTFLRRAQAAMKLRLRRLGLGFLVTGVCCLACASFFAPTAQGQTADLQLVQTASATAVAGGSDFVYTETVTNNTS
jgi:hypothetical protein